MDDFVRMAWRREAQAHHEWRRIEFREIGGMHWLIVGFGTIGQETARRARAFGARVTGIRRDVAPHPDADRVAPLEALPSLLPESDIVVLSCPLNDATRDMADGGFFSRMKAGSMLVNVGRGGLVDEAAL